MDLPGLTTMRKMTNETTMDKLREMRLTALAEAFSQSINRFILFCPQFRKRLGLLVDIEIGAVAKATACNALLKKAPTWIKIMPA